MSTTTSATTPHRLLDQPEARLSLPELVPAGYRTLTGVAAYAARAVDPPLHELIKLRASILNGCSFCTDMHSADALAHGEATHRLFAVAARHEAPWFTRRERAALALTDAMTRLGPEGVPDDVVAGAREQFSDVELADLVIAIGMINLWNRVAITSRTLPPSR